MSQSDFQENQSKAVLKNLVELHQQTTYHNEFDRMKRSISPFLDHFGLNHFYYVRISPCGYYTTLGTHSNFHEFAFNQPKMLSSCPCIRHPNNLKPGVFIENSSLNEDFIDSTKIIWNNFKINFTICIRIKTNEGCESFGFGTKSTKTKNTETLINELPLVYKFINYFTSENRKLLQMAHENQVDMIPLIGSRFYEREKGFSDSSDRVALLRHMGLEPPETLTDREMEILQYFAFGYPAKYIASKLYISVRTVENYIAGLKLKLNCNSKVELIKKSHQFIIDKNKLL